MIIKIYNNIFYTFGNNMSTLCYIYIINYLINNFVQIKYNYVINILLFNSMFTATSSFPPA